MPEEKPSLGQLIWLVRRELEWARQVDIDHPLRFDVGSVELDVVVEASRSTSGGGGLDLKVMGVGASGELSRANSSGFATTVHVVLTPRDIQSADGRYEISAEDTEPPPRRSEVTGPDGLGLEESRMARSGAGAPKAEPQPGG